MGVSEPGDSMSVFPEGFSDLEVFSDWALARETARNQKRLMSNMARIQEFYDAMIPRMDDIFAHLNELDLAGMSEKETNLLQLTFALAEVSFAVEVYKQPQVSNSFQEYGGAERFITVHDRL